MTGDGKGAFQCIRHDVASQKGSPHFPPSAGLTRRSSLGGPIKSAHRGFGCCVVPSLIPFVGVELARIQRLLGGGLFLFSFCSTELGAVLVCLLCGLIARLCLLEAAQVDDLSH